MEPVINKFKKLTIVNFQSHKNTVVEFDENGITSFQGKTDSGKSAMERAIDFVINNQPTGDAFVSDWVPRTKKGNVPKGNAEVTLETTLGYVRRVKGKDNLYFIKTNDMEEERRLENFGSGKVPDEVKAFFNFSDINIQTQKDTHFLLNDNPPTVAKYINTIMDMEIVDKTVSNVNSMVRAAKSLKETKAATIESVAKQLEPFQYVDSCDAMLSRIENKQIAADNTASLVNNVTDLLDNKVTINDKITTTLAIVGYTPRLSSISETMKAIIDNERSVILVDSKNNQAKENKRNKLRCDAILHHSPKVGTLLNFNDVLCSSASALAKIEKLNLDLQRYSTKFNINKKIEEFNLSRVTNKTKLYGKSVDDLKRLEELVASYEGTTKKIKANTDLIAEKKAEYLEIRGDECPTCKKPW